MLTVIAGGTGSVKLIRGLRRVAEEPLSVIANVGDNIRLHGLYIAPDVDTVVYALAGILDEERGWGVRNDTFNTLEQLSLYGEETWFRLGDRDLATHVTRTRMMASGRTLSEVTQKFCGRLGVDVRVIPASDDHVETAISTSEGQLHLQEYWVKRGARDRVLGVEYRGARQAKPAPGVVEAINSARAVVLCPANPVTSIGPTLAIPGIKRALVSTRAVKVTVSPIVGEAPVSGPAGRLMKGLGVEVSPLGVAKLYSDFLDLLVIDKSDEALVKRVEDAGIRALCANTVMRSPEGEDELARFLLDHIP